MLTMFSTFLFATLLVAQSQSPVGMILMTDSSVQVQRGTAINPAHLGDLLYAGDRVTTGASSGKVTLLYCPSSERLTATNGNTVDLGPAVVKAANAAGLTRAAAKCVLPQVALGKESLERIGGMRARGNPPILLYTGGPLTSARPTFSWAAFPGTQEYRLAVTDVNGDPVWEYRGTAATASYPQNMPPLKEAEFTWEVSAVAGGKVIAQQNATFKVKPDAELSIPVAAGDPAALMLRATELENAGYFSEAAACFRQLRAANTGDDRFSKRLAVLYWNAGLIAAVSEELDKITPQK
jgi:hypothetical protein